MNSARLRSFVLRQKAIAEGKDSYFTGVPCCRGHLAYRRVDNNHCLACVAEPRPTQNHSAFWTEARLAVLRRGLDVGDSRSTIAARLGTTRNAICGEIWRMGWNSGPKPVIIKPKSEKPTASKAKPESAVPKAKPESAVPKAKPETAVPKAHLATNSAPIVSMLRVFGAGPAHAALTASQCRWPNGSPHDDTFHFCPEQAQMGQRYCVEHREVSRRKYD